MGVRLGVARTLPMNPAIAIPRRFTRPARKAKFLESFPGKEIFVEKLKAQKRMNVNNQLHQILSLSKLYMKEDFVEAINKCLEYNVFNHSFISGYLEKNHKKSFKIEPVKIKLDLPRENVKRDLSQYNLLK